MAVSQNGWPVSPPRRARQVGNRGAKVTVADGPPGDVLVHVCTQVDARVEDIDLKSTRGEFDDWGYADRNVRGSGDISNHASATAVDINATRHPLGRIGTFRAEQVAEIHRILDEVDNVVRWGGDYFGRKDEMHFEINAGYAAVKRVADRLNSSNAQEDDMTPTETRALNAAAADAKASRAIGVVNQQHIYKIEASVAGLVKVVAADKDIEPAALQKMLDTAVAKNMAEQRAFLEQIVRDVVPEEQAEQIVARLAEKLAA